MKTWKLAWMLLVVVCLLPGWVPAQGQKVALLVLSLDVPQDQDQELRAFLTAKGFAVTAVPASRFARVVDAITVLGQASQQNGYTQFLFYFRGHGADNGALGLTDAKGNTLEVVNTYDKALAVFTEVVADSYTFVLDCCFAEDSMAEVIRAAGQSGKSPAGWVLGACSGDPRSIDKGYTYDTRYGRALIACDASLPAGYAWTDLRTCVHNARFTGPGVNPTISKPEIRPIDSNQPAGIPIF